MVLTEAPALAKPFVVYVSERKGIAVGVLTQKLETETYPVAYLSKKPDGTALGWPGCLTAIAATALLMEEAMSITLGQQLEVLTPYPVRATLELKSHLWVSGERLTKY
jgi:hypothetical protein